MNKKTKRNDEVKIAQAPDYARIYSNNVRLGFSPWDMWITFGEVTKDQENEPIFVEERVKVTMSLQHAKTFAELLLKNIKLYEERTATISQHHKPEDLANAEIEMVKA